ncbi:cytochrome b/b6 domain-containing protein [Teredinibacter waterburyi]|jgi:Cytochrome b|uniref:cytochrome b/b6 domain-containing protein n=1 Tax=Teredinibacter waterburyi TaxID=1500538 RepID=UPI00165FAE91|nr:cytochrome b/b6 domain-containing protein [Teredinibacter waterburyi]
MDEIVWDRVVRLFHWLTAALFLLSYFVLEGGELWHRVAGYTIGGLLFVRTVWGFVGSPTARFVSFFPTPKRLLGYLRNFPHGQGSTLGHNPLGGLMVLWMLLLLSALVLTGWMQGLDRYWGEEWLMDIHELVATIMLWSVAIHVFAVVVMQRLTGKGLVKAMITGRRQ